MPPVVSDYTHSERLTCCGHALIQLVRAQEVTPSPEWKFERTPRRQRTSYDYGDAGCGGVRRWAVVIEYTLLPSRGICAHTGNIVVNYPNCLERQLTHAWACSTALEYTVPAVGLVQEMD